MLLLLALPTSGGNSKGNPGSFLANMDILAILLIFVRQ
jgi:hypothetical protein